MNEWIFFFKKEIISSLRSCNRTSFSILTCFVSFLFNLFNQFQHLLLPSFIGSSRTVRTPATKNVNPSWPPTTTAVNRTSLDYAGSVLRTHLQRNPIFIFKNDSSKWFIRLRRYHTPYALNEFRRHLSHSEPCNRTWFQGKCRNLNEPWKSTPSLCSIVLRFVEKHLIQQEE